MGKADIIYPDIIPFNYIYNYIKLNWYYPDKCTRSELQATVK